MSAVPTTSAPITLIKGKLSVTTVSSNFNVSSCDAEPEIVNFQYTVATNNDFAGACGDVTTPVPAGSITVAGNGGKQFSLKVPVPNCPGSHFFTVTLQAIQPNGDLVGRILATATTGFLTTDIVNGNPGVVNGVLHLSGAFVPDPASNPQASAVVPGSSTGVPVTTTFNGFGGGVNYYIAVGFSTGFIGAFHNGTFLGTDTGVGNTWLENIVVGYLNPCDAAQGEPPLCGFDNGGFNTNFALAAGDTIDFYMIAVDQAQPIMRPLLPGQPIGPRLGSVTLTPVAN
jgi:hypothetical protein